MGGYQPPVAVAKRSRASNESPWYEKAFVVYLGCWAIAVAVYGVTFLQSGMLPPDMPLRYLEYHIIDFHNKVRVNTQRG